jgi:hypothetical protein
MPKQKKGTVAAPNSLSTEQRKQRGRPWTVRPREITGRADNYRGSLENVWASLWPSLSQVQTEEDVIKALQNARPYDREFAPWASLILDVLKDPHWPKRQSTRIKFLADSLAGLGVVSPRRSRDICAEQRAKERRAHHILRYEVYVECSCGYRGHSHDHACPKCGAKIQFEWAPITMM